MASDERPQNRELISLAGRVAVVTGAAQGIGLAAARRFAQGGAAVLLADLDAARASAAAEELSATVDAEVAGLGAEVSDEDSVAALAAAATERHGRLDVWANFAATGYPKQADRFLDVLDTPLDEWNRIVAVNLTGSFLCARAAAREMVAAGNGGVILNTTTTVVDRYPGHPGLVPYAASKGGIAELTMMLAAELGPRGIRVLALKPTVIETEGMREHLEALGDVMGTEEPFGELEGMMPLRRFGTPDDVARVALFAASDMAAFLTGCVLPVDGGELAV